MIEPSQVPSEASPGQTKWSMGEVPMPADYLDRRNFSPAALGKIRRTAIFGKPYYTSPMWYVRFLTLLVTAAIIVTNLAAVWHSLLACELFFFSLLAAVAHYSAFRLCVDEPGIYPRLADGEVDPLQHCMHLVYCRTCKLRRPPRTAHCYHCDVCVLTSDHFCGLHAASVSSRTLRWFTLYLVGIASTSLNAFVWQVRFLLYLMWGQDLNLQGLGGRDSAAAEQSIYKEYDSAFHVLSFAALILDIGVGGMLVVGAGFYSVLTLTDTTRRESQRSETPLAMLRNPRLLVRNLRRAANPPPSMVEDNQISHREREEEEDSPLV